MTTIVTLISCVSMKRQQSCKAKDMYVSPWFVLARKYAEKYGDSWFILSARYGLVSPDDLIEPYNQSLNGIPKYHRAAWAGIVLFRLGECAFQKHTEFVFMAGKRYREFLTLPLATLGYTVSVPMRGLGIGQQQAWLKEKIQCTQK